MSSDFPTHAEIGEQNVREWLQRRQQYCDDDLQYVRVSMREDK